MSNYPRPRLGHDILCVFDVWQDARDFLSDVIETHQAPRETEELLQQSLVAGSQDWHLLVERADSIRRVRGVNPASLDGQDVLESVWHVLAGIDHLPTSEPWALTDRLIARAKELEQDPEILPPFLDRQARQARQGHSYVSSTTASSDSPAKAKPPPNTSHYWSDQIQEQRPRQSHKWTWPQTSGSEILSLTIRAAEHANSFNIVQGGPAQVESSQLQAIVLSEESTSRTGINTGEIASSNTSPYFIQSASSEQSKLPAKKRPPAGTISAVPFPPLTAPTFGLVQEVFAHDPFWLLVAVTFLIRTKGRHAIPVLYKVKERFSSPMDIADPANTEELVGLIRHLGLSIHRIALLKKYARGFLNDPPRAGVRYRVKNYDQRDFDPSNQVCTNIASDDTKADSLELEQRLKDLEGWEIGHLTQGKYAIDSWRIFCRDQLLGRATNCDGGGREPEFQPEWMRVRPDDKELRAYLRWMWMREGWEWDPITGERVVLREEMRSAVDEERVEYDDMGGLRILDEPRAS